MQNKDVTLRDSAGLHARPASLFVKTANRFQSTILVRVGEKQADAKSIMQILKLGAKNGTTITIIADGSDEEEAAEALVHLVVSNFE